MNYSEFNSQNPAFRYNGRVDISKPSSLQIPNFQQKSVNNASFYYEAVQGGFTPNEVSNLFFSCNNIDVLQDGLRYKIYTLTDGKYVIGRQSEHDLKIIMRSIYLQYSKNLKTDIVSQVRELNSLVLDWAAKEVFSNLKQYNKYIKDVSTLPIPLARSPLMTNKGSKTLETKSFV